MPKNNNALCFVAGRSGGHLVPALTIAQQYKESDPTLSIIFISTATELDKKILTAAKVVDHYYSFKLDNLPGKKLWRYPRFLYDFMHACWHSFNVLRKHKPTKIISTGGYSAFPVCIIARLLHIPIELYELNALPGKAIKALAPLAQRIACCFAPACQFFPAHKVHPAPYPIRFTTNAHASPPLPPQFNANKKTILVLGGSQGSRFINSLMTTWLTTTALQDHIQIIHQTGMAHLEQCTASYTNYHIPAIVFDYSTKIEEYYHLADLVICRSGAGSLFETLFFKKPCITIPLETAETDHQVHNAQAIAREHPELFTVLLQQEITQDLSIFDRCIRINLKL